MLDLVKLNVGVDVHLGKVAARHQGRRGAGAAQGPARPRRRDRRPRPVPPIDRNPELVKSLGKAVEDVGSGAGKTLGETGEAVEDVGEGAEGAVQDVGKGAGQAVGDIGEGAGDAVGQIGEGAGQAVGRYRRGRRPGGR